MTIKPLRGAAFMFWLASAGLLRAAIPPTENLLPADTLAFLAVPDCAAARLAAKSAPGLMFWNDPAMKPFHDKLAGKWNDQYLAPLEHDLGINLDRFVDLAQGQFALATTVNGSNGHDDVPPGLLLLLDTKDQSSALKTNLATLVKKWNEAGRALRTESYHGLAFTVVPLSSNDFAGILPKKTPVSEIGQPPPKPQKPGEIYIAQFEGLLIMGNAPKVVEPVAAHLTGGSVPALGDNPAFAADKLSQFRDHPQAFAWFNGKAFFDLISQAPAADTESASPLGNFSPAKTLGALGLTGLKSVSLALRQTHDGSTMTVHITAPEATRAGLLKILALPPRDAGVPPFVPADAVKFTRLRLDGKQTWAELQKMIEVLTPNGQAGLNAVLGIANSLGQQKNPGFDIRNDLFGNLNDDLISYQKAAGSGSADPSAPPTLYLVSVANADAMIGAIKTIAAMSNPQSDATPPREFLGRKIHSIALKPTRTAGGMELHSLYVSASGGYVALSSDQAMVEEFLRGVSGQNKALRDNPALQGALQQLGGAGGGLLGYENQRETMRATFKTLQTPLAADTLKLFPPAIREWMDFSLMPNYDLVSKYFYISTFVGSANSEGLTFTAFAPRPPGLN